MYVGRASGCVDYVKRRSIAVKLFCECLIAGSYFTKIINTPIFDFITFFMKP